MKRDYPRLSIEGFGAQLLESGDLDPLYIALTRAELDENTLKRWLLAYWCLYSAGEASYLAQFEGPLFFHWLEIAARNEVRSPVARNEKPTPLNRWCRGHERRHWRGVNALRSFTNLNARYGRRPESFVDYVAGGAPKFYAVSGRVQEHASFGPWIAFKVADMLDRVLGIPVSFEQAEVFMFDSPREAALDLWWLRSEDAKAARAEILDATGVDLGDNVDWNARPGDGNGATGCILGKDAQAAAVQSSVDYLVKAFSVGWMAPPRFDRPIGLQEVETILCKWKSHRNGHYPLWNDVDEIRVGLFRWRYVSPIAEKLYQAMPARPEEEGGV